MHVLVVDHEPRTRRRLMQELGRSGYRTEAACNGRDGLDKAMNGKWDLILLDAKLPGLSGLEVLARIRNLDEHTPVIMLNAAKSLSDKVAGLDGGADDYLVRPFEMEELLARIRRCLRTGTAAPPRHGAAGRRLGTGGLLVDTDNREAFLYGKSLRLTTKEYDLLSCLLSHRGQALSRDQILDSVWGYDFEGGPKIVDVYVGYLRKKTGNGGGKSSSVIETVRGFGYRIRREYK
ncbi:response regulator transcription factor [Paenibacillus sp. D51F]